MKNLAFMGLALLVITTFSVPFAVSIESYKVVVRALDKDSAPLNGAWVKITTQYAIDDLRSQEKQTNASGLAVFDQINSSLPSAKVRIYWHGVIVAYQTVTLNPGANEFIVYCNVSTLMISTVDSNNNPLRTAEVTVRWVTDITYSATAITNGEGKAVFPQMPHYKYQVFARWQNMLVHESTFNMTSSTSTYLAHCQVFRLAVHVATEKNLNIQGSTVTIARTDKEWSLLNTTGSDDTAVFRQVPFGNYTIRATYQATSNVTIVSLTENTEISLKLNITGSFEVTVQVTWSDGEPVSEAMVAIQDNYGQHLLSGITDTDGILTVTLGDGAYMVRVVKNALSITKNITVLDQTIVSVTFNASLRTYTLAIEVVDEKGLIVDNAVVELYQNGTFVGSSQTIGGTAVFNVKLGTYRVIAKLDNEQREKIVEVKDDVKQVMSFFESNQTTLLLAFLIIPMLIAASVGLLIFHFKQRKRLF